MLIKNVFIEGPDCSGKTTVINKIHKHTNYRYHMFDRSRMSQYIFSSMYERGNIHQYSELYLEEKSDLSNLYIVLLPDLEEVLDRFNKRGDEIHDANGIKIVYYNFKRHAGLEVRYPNVIIVKSNDGAWVDVLGAIENYEKKKEFNVIKNFVHSELSKECVRLKSSEFGELSKLKKDKECMKFKKEKEYYEKIEKEFIQKFLSEATGDNEYNRKEQINSRRFIFVSDTCISSIHALVRNNTIYFNAYMRSSNVDQVRHDYSFIKNLVVVFNNLIQGQYGGSFKFYKLNLSFGSAHVIKEQK